MQQCPYYAVLYMWCDISSVVCVMGQATSSYVRELLARMVPGATAGASPANPALLLYDLT